MDNWIIDGINFKDLESEKYWSFPKSYKGDAKADTTDMIFSNEYIGSRKMDGAYYRFIKDDEGNMVLQGRSRSVSGDFLNKIGHVPHLNEFFNSLPNGTCLLGEIYFPNKEGSNNVTTIMGCKEEKAILRQTNGDKLHYYIFDVWAWNGKSQLNTKIENRIEILKNIPIEVDYVEVAEYCRGEELWELLTDTLSVGGEGIVMTKIGTVPSPGKRTARKTLKVKKELSDNIDCFFTGVITPATKQYSGKDIENWEYWMNINSCERLKGKYFRDYEMGSPIIPITKPYFNKWAGSLEIGVMNNGKVYPIGYISGLADEIKANYKDYKGKCIEVSAMQIHETGGLRHAKLMKFRPDLTPHDCTLEKYMGNE